MATLSSQISSRAWGDVDKTALGNAVAKAYASGSITKSQIRQIYLYVPDDAFDKDSEGNPVFAHSKAKLPVAEFSGGSITINRNGVHAAAAALAGGRGGVDLPAADMAAAKRRLRGLYRRLKEDAPDSLKESLEPLERGKPLEELVKGSLDYTVQQIRDAFHKQFEASMGETYRWYIQETFEDHVIVSSWSSADALKPDEYYMVVYEKDGDTYSFAPRDEWEVVELAYQPQTKMESMRVGGTADRLDEADKRTTDQVNAADKTTTDRGNAADKTNGKRGKTRFEDRADAVLVNLLEAEDGGPRRLRVQGAMTVDVVNGNGRRYPRPVVQEALIELRRHLHESSAGSGRAIQLLGEAEHPSDKASRRPSLLETVTRWTSVDLHSDSVDLEGHVVETSKGKDILALAEGGVQFGVSMRGYGDSKFVKEDGKTVEEVTELHITGFDLVLEPSFANTAIVESQQEESKMDPEQIRKLIQEHPEWFKGMFTEDVTKLSDEQLKRFEEKAREMLGIGKDGDFGEALKEAAEAKKELAERKRKEAVDTAIVEATKELPYGKSLNESFVEELHEVAGGGQVEAVKGLAESMRKRYDKMVAKQRIEKMGGGNGDGVQVLGPVLESEAGVPEFARASWLFTEALVKVGEGRIRNYAKMADLSRNEVFAKAYLERFDKVFGGYLKMESRMLEEAETTVDLNLPYSVSRAIVAEAIPQLIATSVFDVGVVDQSPLNIWFERFAGETGFTVTVTDEAVTADTGVWVALAQKRLTPGTVVITTSPAGTTYVEGTDYVIDYELGQLMALSGGAIADAAALLADYQYTAIRKGEMATIERGELQLTYQTLNCAADRLAQQISSEAVVFGRSQLGWDATTRTLVGLIDQIRRKIDQGLLYKALAASLRVASNSGGTWDSSAQTELGYDTLSRAVGSSRTKVSGAGRYYKPNAIVSSEAVGDLAANWKGFTQAGSRPDASLNANGFIGKMKGLPWFGSPDFSDGYILVTDRQVVMHRVYQPMRLDGPHKSRDATTGKLIAAEEWFAEEYNGSLAPVPEKASHVVVT